MHVTTRMKAIAALVLAGILGGMVPPLTKIALTEFSSIQILFLRFGMGSLLILPLFFTYLKKVTLKKLLLIIPAGLLFSGNVLLFVVGVRFTTSIVTQILYLLTPVFVSLIGYFLLKEQISSRRIASMIICFGGSSLLVFRSIQDTGLIRSIGTFQGNIIVLCAVLSWSLYIVYTKKISNRFRPTHFMVSNFIITLVISLIMFTATNTSIILTIGQLTRSSLPVLLSVLTLGTVNTIIFFFLYQWCLKNLSAFIVASSNYISPLATAFIVIPFFGEQLSETLLISAACICIGSYLILSEKKQ